MAGLNASAVVRKSYLECSDVQGASYLRNLGPTLISTNHDVSGHPSPDALHTGRSITKPSSNSHAIHAESLISRRTEKSWPRGIRICGEYRICLHCQALTGFLPQPVALKRGCTVRGGAAAARGRGPRSPRTYKDLRLSPGMPNCPRWPVGAYEAGRGGPAGHRRDLVDAACALACEAHHTSTVVPSVYLSRISRDPMAYANTTVDVAANSIYDDY